MRDKTDLKKSQADLAGKPRGAKTVGVVLAGGRSRRMGFDKTEVLLEVGTLLEHAVRRLLPLADRVLLVGRRADDLRLGPIEGHEDAYPEAGPLGGIATALCLARPRPCLIIPCDMPMLTTDLLGGLLAAHDSSVDCTLAVNPTTGRWEPLVGVYEACCLAPFQQAIADRRLAIWRTLERLRVRRLSIPAAQADQFINLNTPDDLARWGQVGS
jgi:molybdopterin-guanine dinucleotide biosynthesis protein A